jgi:hypothetical protein
MQLMLKLTPSFIGIAFGCCMHGPVRVVISGFGVSFCVIMCECQMKIYKKISIVKNTLSSLFTEKCMSQNCIGTRLFGTALIKGSYVTGKVRRPHTSMMMQIQLHKSKPYTEVGMVRRCCNGVFEVLSPALQDRGGPPQ